MYNINIKCENILTHIPEVGCEVDGEALVAELSVTARPVGVQ